MGTVKSSPCSVQQHNMACRLAKVRCRRSQWGLFGYVLVLGEWMVFLGEQNREKGGLFSNLFEGDGG